MPDRKKVRLLVIDDHEEYFELIKEYADMCSHQFDIICTYSESGERGLELIRSWSPSIVIMDAHLPDVHAYSLLEVCNDEACPVIVTSDQRSNEIEQSMLAQGACAYLPKTDNPDEMESLLYQIHEHSLTIDYKH